MLGRWNSRGARTVYTSLDPATAILEVAVQTGFAALDTVAHVLTAATVVDLSAIHIVQLEDVPNPNWLRPGIPGAGQQGFGDALLAAHPFVLIPSAVSTHSWNLIFVASVASGKYAVRLQERFALDMASAVNQGSLTRAPRMSVAMQTRLKMSQCRSPGSTT